MVSIYKMHIKEINIKNQACNCYFDNLIETNKQTNKRIETKNILIDEGNHKDLVIFLRDMFTVSQ